MNGTLVVDSGNLIGIPNGLTLGQILQVDGSNKPLLANNGGPTQTILLVAGSPAVDAGLAGNAIGVTTDQRGRQRPQFAAPDIGAVEASRAELGLPFVTAADGAIWYVGPQLPGNFDQRIYREVAGVQTEVGGLAAQVGLLGDGSMVARTAGGAVFSRTGSAAGLGSAWVQLLAIAGADGASWFLSPEVNVNGDNVIYRWQQGAALQVSGGAARTVTLAPNGEVRATTLSGARFQRLGSATGLGTSWMFLAESLFVTTTADQNDGTSDPQFGGTSLREAIAFANTNPGPDTITFASGLLGQTITLSSGWLDASDASALRVTSDVTLQGLSGAGVTLAVASGVQKRHLLVQSGASLTANNFTFTSGNVADSGGAISNQGTLTLTDVRFNNNNATQLGGAINNDGNASIIGATFTSNSGGEAGAIQSIGTLNVTNSTFANNSSQFNGGALRLAGTATITGSTFNGNTVVNEGGGLISFGNTTIRNSTFADNGKHALVLWEGTANLDNITVAYNRNGGLVVASANTTLRNSIVAGNTTFDVFGALASGTSNNLTNVSASAAGLSTLANNGGPTQTIALVTGSPAINAGNNNLIPNVLTTDQRGGGFARIIGGTVDIGAIEVPNAPVLTSVVVNGGDAFASAAQRSQVTSLTVTFNEPVVLAPGAFTILNYGLDSAPGLAGAAPTILDQSQILVTGSGTTYTIRFGAGPGVVTRHTSTGQGRGNSLVDGNLLLTIDPTKVKELTNIRSLAATNNFGDGDNEFGDRAVDNFFRLFGDSDGTGVVNSLDTGAFSRALTTYNAAVDFNGDGVVQNSGVDRTGFLGNFNKRRRSF